MKIAVWKTGHEIADTVSDALMKGLPDADVFHTSQVSDGLPQGYDAHIAYGILRGCTEVFRRADAAGVDFFIVDRGYFGAAHFDGFYRISRGCTQQTNFDKLEFDSNRFDRLGIKFEASIPSPDSHTLICPPTQPVLDFFGLDGWQPGLVDGKYIVRHKGDKTPLEEHLKDCRKVITFNSSVGWEALRRGIAAESDPNHSIVGAWQKMIDKPLHLDLNARRKLFVAMGGLQMTLSEISAGCIWPLMKRLMSISDGTPARPLPPTLQPTVSASALNPLPA